MQGGSRIVLDAKGPVRLDKAFVLDAAEGQPARLVLDLVATDRASFMRSRTGKPSRRPERIGQAERAAAETRRRCSSARRARSRPWRHRRRHKGDQAENSKKMSCSPSHRHCARSWCSGKLRVAMTRSEDVFIPLGERVRFARSRSAGLFISLHADALPRREGQAEGATVYTLRERVGRRGGPTRRNGKQGRRHCRRGPYLRA